MHASHAEKLLFVLSQLGQVKSYQYIIFVLFMRHAEVVWAMAATNDYFH